MFLLEEVYEKKRRVLKLMEELNLDAIYIKRPPNFTWLTGGGLNIVGITVELGVAGLLLSKNGEYVICNNIEAPRMEKEERLEDQGYEIRSFPWYEEHEVKLVRELSGGGKLGADHNFADSIDVSKKINILRYSLTPWEVERYKEIGHLTSLAIEETAKTVRPGDKECAVVGHLAERLWENRLDYITTFCAADERISDFRHPIPTEKKIKNRVMICVNSRRQGLIVSLTRFVQFGPVPEELRKKYNANVFVDCTLMANTIPGRPVVKAFLRGIEAYKQTGYADEYKLHHQGGATGYTGRDYRVNFNTREIVQKNQAFAWNPSITGSKSEDTMIATSEGPILISRPVIFPELKMEVDGFEFKRADILEM